MDWLMTFSIEMSVALLSYEASVRMERVMEFMMSFVGAFMITSRVKFVGSSRISARRSVKRFASSSSGSSPNRRRYVRFSYP